MRNAVLLAGIWVGIIVFAYGVVYWGSGPTEIPYLPDVPFTETVYADSAGKYEATLPAGWAARDGAAFAVLAGPEPEIQGAILVVVGDDPETAVDEAWAIYRPDIPPVPERITVGSEFESDGPDWHVSYRLPDDRAAITAAYVAPGSIVVLIVEGSAEAMERRAQDIEAIQVVPLEGAIPQEPLEAVKAPEEEEAPEEVQTESDEGLMPEEAMAPEGDGEEDADLPQPEAPETDSDAVEDEANPEDL